MRKLLVTDNIDFNSINPLKKFFTVDEAIGISQQELLRKISEYECIITRSTTAVPAELITKANKLKIIARAGIGVDNIDIFTATSKKIAVINAPLGNARATAEHTIGLILALLRNIPQADADLKKGIWGKKKYVGRTILNKTLGIVGFGNVGSQVHKMAKGLGMNVIVCEPYIRMPDSVEHVTFETLFKKSDIITFHVPQTYLTRHMFNKFTLNLCKEGVFIVNASRGEVIDQKAVLSGLKSEKIGGIALDVFSEEPFFDRELFSFPNVIATPHLGGSTKESQKESITEVVKGIILYIQGTVPNNLLNPQVFIERKTTRRKKLGFEAVIFDCDSTLTKIEGIDELAAFVNLKDKISTLTRKAMEGELSFEDVFHQRLSLLTPSKHYLEKLADLYLANLTEDAKETVAALKYLGKKVYLVSGGYTPSLLKMAFELGIPAKNVFANDLIFDLKGNFVSHIEGPLIRNHGKLQIVRQIPGRKVMIGDGITDLESKYLVDLFLGYGGVTVRKKVEDESDIFIYSQSMSSILVIAAGIEGCIKLLSTKYRKYVGKGIDLLTHPAQTKIKKGRKVIFSDLKELAYF